MSVNVILGLLSALSFALAVWQLVVAFRFPLDQRRKAGKFSPGVSILKPLKGCDTKTEECLRSWLTQDFVGPIEILFGVASADDPVCAVVDRLLKEHPGRSAQLMICGAGNGSNAKVSKLVHLARQARHDIICVSDADVWMPPDGLDAVVQELRDPAVGLVHCLYRFADSPGLAMRLESFAVNADFWSQVLQARSLGPMDFALGAAMTLRRESLEAAGGFAALEDFLADDFELGQRIAAGGSRVVLSPLVVECRFAAMDAASVWDHQVRWARTVRGCRPWGYFFSILANITLWPMLWLVYQPGVLSLAATACCLGFRMLSGCLLERRMAGRTSLGSCGIALLKDLAQTVVWAAAFTGRTVVWRGEQLRVMAGGKLARVAGT